MTPAERSSVKNGIWLCQTCSTLIDKDELKYSVVVLNDWKEKAEQAAELNQPPQSSSSKQLIRPDFTNSDRESHKLLKKVFDLQIDRGVIDTIQATRDALSIENQEEFPDKCTIVFAQYLLVHYLLSDVKNIPEAFGLIDAILAFDKVKSDIEFYSDVMIEKAKALVLSGKVAQAHNALRLVNNPDKVGYLEVEGLVLFYEGKAEQAIETLTKGQDKALQEFVTAITEDNKRASYQHYYSFLTQLGSLYRCIQRPDLSLSLWKKAVAAANDLGYTKEKARTIIPYVECLLQYEYFDDAFNILNEAYTIKENDNDDYFFWQYYNLKAAIHVRRNCKEQNDVKHAIDSLQELLKRGVEANEAIIVLRTIAHIQAENGLSRDAKESLELANQIADVGEKSYHKEGIEVQLNDIKNSERPFGYNYDRPSEIPPSSEQLKSMIEMYSISESSIERLRLSFDIGMGYIDIDPNLSYKWLEESKKLANKLLNKHIEARSLIGQAMILFGRKTQDSEEKARAIIERAVCLMNDIPIWDTRARIMMFKGMALAHIEDFSGAYKCFQEADEILNVHAVKDVNLLDHVAYYLEECKTILTRKRFTDFDFETIISELDELKNWFPKYSKELQQFLWYNRHEDIERLIITSHGAKAFMVSDSQDELFEWIEGLCELFDIVSFTSETDYHNEHNWNFATMLPVPKNMRSNYFNVSSVLTLNA